MSQAHRSSIRNQTSSAHRWKRLIEADRMGVIPRTRCCRCFVAAVGRRTRRAARVQACSSSAACSGQSDVRLPHRIGAGLCAAAAILVQSRKPDSYRCEPRRMNHHCSLTAHRRALLSILPCRPDPAHARAAEANSQRSRCRRFRVQARGVGRIRTAAHL